MNVYIHSKSDFSQVKTYLGIGSLPSVYIVRLKKTKFYKIGRTKSNLAYRLSSLQCGCPFELNLLGSTRTPIPNKIEGHLHSIFHKNRHRGEWFTLAEDEAAKILEFFLATSQHVEIMFNGMTGDQK